MGVMRPSDEDYKASPDGSSNVGGEGPKPAIPTRASPSAPPSRPATPEQLEKLGAVALKEGFARELLTFYIRREFGCALNELHADECEVAIRFFADTEWEGGL